MLVNTINHDLLLLRKWFSINEMLVNINKKKYINIDHTGFEIPIQLIFHKATCNSQLRTCGPLRKVKN